MLPILRISSMPKRNLLAQSTTSDKKNLIWNLTLTDHIGVFRNGSMSIKTAQIGIKKGGGLLLGGSLVTKTASTYMLTFTTRLFSSEKQKAAVARLK
jgi:hypothetical protein